MQALIDQWFDCWVSGQFREVPVSDDFTHVSPIGLIEGKAAYLKVIEDNQEAFLGHQFEILDSVLMDDKASLRYVMQKGEHSLEVCDWFYFADGRIKMIVSYFNT